MAQRIQPRPTVETRPIRRESLVNWHVYVEGGGNHDRTLTECRRGFQLFFKKVVIGPMPRITACGGRDKAYKRFCGNLSGALLLVDSEGPIGSERVWDYLKTRDGWEKPAGATEDQAHLMVQIMESWFLADKDTVTKYYGSGFRAE